MKFFKAEYAVDCLQNLLRKNECLGKKIVSASCGNFMLPVFIKWKNIETEAHPEYSLSRLVTILSGCNFQIACAFTRIATGAQESSMSKK